MSHTVPDGDGERGFLLGALDAIEDGVAFLDRERRFTWANEWMEARLASEVPLVGRLCHEVFKGLSGACSDCAGETGLSTGPVQSRVFARPSAGDAEEWFEVRLSPVIVGRKDEASGCVVHVRDITHGRRVEGMLQDEIARRRMLVEQSRDGIVVLDSEGKVFETNQEFARMLGYSMAEVADLHVWDWEAVAPRERLEEMITTVDDAGDHFETQHRRKDGSIYDVEISTNGAVIGDEKLIFCVCRDVSERKRAEREREELIGKLQEALAEVETLKGIVPVCAFCKKVRDDEGYWEQVEVYIRKHSRMDVSHGICPECMKKHYPGMFDDTR